MTRDEIVDEARIYVDLKTKWRHQGRTKIACDCIGLILGVADKFGVPYEDQSGYSRNPDGRFVDILKATFQWRSDQRPQHGCIVVLRDDHQPCHVGVIVEKWGKLYMIHCDAMKRRAVEEEFDQYWKSKFRCVLDFPGVED